jgi:CheY-like chemotaxis protein
MMVMSSMMVLLVDDDSDDREFFRIALEEIDSSIHLLTAASGKEALRIIHQLTVLPYLIFLDLNMPHMDGREFLKQVKANHLTKKIPVVIVTTSNHPRDIDETRNLGASDFITKPSTVNELIEALSFIFKTSNKYT